MKKNTLYVICLALFIVSAGLVVLKFRGDQKNEQSAVYELLDRKGRISSNT
jgi:hypothetical protein